ncbi:MAG: PilX N-terminal domain-containing pilus assembly protein [Betaproteobacteria bacterium]|nr:PilX N-terminal domain-containing pilus assembly protein [Betaproteobacteria bacterium]
MQRISSAPHHKTQRGIALFIVVVFVLLSMLLALWASRTALFNEIVVGNDVDYQRAFEAAQALLQDAEQDISGTRNDGTYCVGNGSVCRSGAGIEQMPQPKGGDITGLLGRLDDKDIKCADALCAKRTSDQAQDFWNDPATLSAMQAAGARFGQYTGAVTGSDTQAANPILADKTAGQGGWYWVEVMNNFAGVGGNNNDTLIDSGDTGAPNLLTLSADPNVIFRITALALGRKPSTMVVLQQTYMRQPIMD